jgi:nucleoside phosphorylase
MNKQNPYKIFIYCALPSEAKAFIDYFGLKQVMTIRPFAHYTGNELCLTVTGVGKTAMAAALAYSQAAFLAVEQPVLINIGIAGHKSHALGSLFLIEKIIDSDSLKSHYPQLILKPPCPTLTVRTSSRPQLTYEHSDLCDMEASAFYETAIRFSSSELIHCFKIISDNQSSPANTVNPKQVIALISPHLPTIVTFVGKITEMSGLVNPEMTQDLLFDDLTEKFHFTASQKMHLKSRLSRWRVLTDNQDLVVDEENARNAKDILIWLDKKLVMGS